MVTDRDARDAVRQLMTRSDSINAQGLSIAYVLAERNAGEYAVLRERGGETPPRHSPEYAKLLAIAEEAERTVIVPQIGSQHGKVYAALDDANADWPKAVIEFLDVRTTVQIKAK